MCDEFSHRYTEEGGNIRGEVPLVQERGVVAVGLERALVRNPLHLVGRNPHPLKGIVLLPVPSEHAQRYQDHHSKSQA